MFKVFVYSLFLTFISLIVFNQIISHEIKNQTRELNKINMRGTVVIGEGEMDEAPMLYIGEKLGLN